MQYIPFLEHAIHSILAFTTCNTFRFGFYNMQHIPFSRIHFQMNAPALPFLKSSSVSSSLIIELPTTARLDHETDSTPPSPFVPGLTIGFSDHCVCV